MSSTSQPASIKFETRGTAVVVHVSGNSLDDEELKTLMTGIDHAAAAPGIATIVVSLAGLKMVPSLGLGGFISMSNKCKARQQKLKLTGMSPPIRQVFTITRLDRVLEIVPTLEQAIE